MLVEVLVLVSFLVLFLMFIVVLVISFMRLLFIGGMRRFGDGGIGFGKIPWCIPIGGFAQTWFLLLLFYGGSGVLADPARIDEEFRKAWLPHFCRSGQRDTSLEEFDFEVEEWLPLLPDVSLPRLTGRMLADFVQRKSVSAGGLDGWGWRS